MIHGYAAKAVSAPLEPFEYPSPQLGEEDVEIKIAYCGLCYSDVHMINNDWKISTYPQIPGHEIIGTVVRKGSRVRGVEVGEVVGVGWQCGSCLHCEFCDRGEETFCFSKIRTSVDRPGGFADFIYLNFQFVYPIPKSIDSKLAGPLLCAGITVYSPFKIYQVQASMTVGVIGIGGLGHLALQFSRAFGCHTTAISTSFQKREEAMKLGANRFLCLNKKDELPQNSFDFILSTVHADLDWSLMIQMLRPRGRLCFVGIPNSEVKFPVRLLVSGDRSLSGSGTGSRALMKEMLQFCSEHEIRPQVELFPMKKVNEAIHRLKMNQIRYRAVLYNET